MKLKVYIETSVISYHAGRPSTDLLVLAKQHLTTMWWERVLPKIDPYVSVFVMQEILKGDQQAVKERLKSCERMPALDGSLAIETLAKAYFKKMTIPDKAWLDALHIACLPYTR